MPFLVVDTEGNQTGYFVVMQSVLDAFIQLERSFKEKNGQDTQFSRIRCILKDVFLTENFRFSRCLSESHN